jgi:eukaryotic-like serine/threonine-protein kinase
VSQNYEYFGKYILLEKIATGGMAEVWLARAPQAGGIAKFVAIKKILPQYSDNPEFIQMFKDEAKIAMNLSHSNIVGIYGYDKEQDQLYLVMDYVEGRNLRQILNKLKGTQQKLSISQIVYMMKEIAAGLDHAHRCLDSATGKPLNITHRDMSPQNIMVSFEGEAKIVDFGIAKAETQIENTKTGTLKGKFGYMSPEQAEGQSTDLRTDIFSLGIVLWELLASDRLFIANNEINTLRKIRECQVPSLLKINPNLHPELERITNKALTRDRNLRYQTAAAMHRDLSRFLNKFDPEFTPHDFAVFVKTMYTDEIMDARRKMMEYSKLPGRNEIGKQAFDENVEKTLITSFPQQTASMTMKQKSQVAENADHGQKTDVTITETETDGSIGNLSDIGPPSNSGNSNPFEDDEKTEVSKDHITLGASLSKAVEKAAPSPEQRKKPKTPPSLNIDAMSSIQKQNIEVDTTGGNSHPSYEVESHGRQGAKASNYQRRRESGKRSSSGGSLMAFVVVAVLGYFGLSTVFPQQTAEFEKVVSGMINQPSIGDPSNPPANPVPRNTVPPIEVPEWLKPKPGRDPKVQEIAKTIIVVQSRPSGAEIYIDGLATNQTTPARVEVPSEYPFALKLKKDRYVDYEQQNLTASQVNKKFEAALQKAMLAYIDVIVQPARSGVKLYVNNQLLQDETLPLSRYGVPAKQEIRIRAEIASENLRAEQVITLREDQRQTVVLKLEKKR